MHTVYVQYVPPWVTNKQKKLGEKDLLSVGIMKVIEEKSKIQIGIWIRSPEVPIRGSGSVSKRHRSGTLVNFVTVCHVKRFEWFINRRFRTVE
jgi:hypothetical protein